MIYNVIKKYKLQIEIFFEIYIYFVINTIFSKIWIILYLTCFSINKDLWKKSGKI